MSRSLLLAALVAGAWGASALANLPPGPRLEPGKTVGRWVDDQGQEWVLLAKGAGFEDAARATGAPVDQLYGSYRTERRFLRLEQPGMGPDKALAFRAPQAGYAFQPPPEAMIAILVIQMLEIFLRTMAIGSAQAAPLPPNLLGQGAGTSIGSLLPPMPGASPGGVQTIPASLTPFPASPQPMPPPAGAGGWFQRWPLEGQCRIPSDGVFGASRSGGRRSHHGNDLHQPEGSPVYAVGPGRVILKRDDRGSSDGGYGNYIIVEHEEAAPSGGRYRTLYSHMRDNALVNVGDTVQAGTPVGYVGRTPIGRFRNPHLHFEILVADGSWKGRPTDPMSINQYASLAPGATGTAVAYQVPPKGAQPLAYAMKGD